MAGPRLFTLAFLTVLAGLSAYWLHIPLPEGITERTKLHVFETILRLSYYYPNKIWTAVGVPEWKLHWTRGTLKFFALLLGPWSPTDPDLILSDTTLDGVPVRVYAPKRPTSDGAIVFIHGGGFVLMDVDSYDGLTRELARGSGMVVMSIDYRLAPEHVFPAGLNDVTRATAHFLKNARAYGVDPSKVAIMGDSAGGNLAAVTTHRLREREDLPPLKAQVLVYPVVQYVDFLTPSYQLYHSAYPSTSFLDPESIARWLMLYMGLHPHPSRVSQVLQNNHTTLPAGPHSIREYLRHDHLPEHFIHEEYVAPPEPYGNEELHGLLEPWMLNPEFSPLLHPSLHSLPEALVLTCQYDILRDEGFWYAKRLRDAGVGVEHIHYPDGFHAILNFHTELALGRQAVQDVVAYLKNKLV